MQLTNDWYYFVSAIDKKTCNKIKRLSNKKFEDAGVDRKKGTTAEERITGKKPDMGLDKKARESKICWTNEQWVYDLIWTYMMTANAKAGWNFDITYAESSQITKYMPGGFYTWHTDGGSDSLSGHKFDNNDNLDGTVRKLSMTVLLNDTYDGGDFRFASYSKGKHSVDTPPIDKVGTVIVFPSFKEHKVDPVTKGIRYSLVTWFVGPPFK